MISVRAVLVGVIAVGACRSAEQPSPARGTAASRPPPPPAVACGTRATLFDPTPSVVDADLARIVDPSWRTAPDPDVLARLTAGPAAYVARFRQAVITEPPASHVLAVLEPVAFVGELSVLDPALARTVAHDLVASLDQTIACSTEPGGSTRLRRARAEAELATRTEAELEEMTR